MDKKVFYRSNKQRLKIPEKIIEGFGYNCYRTCDNVRYVGRSENLVKMKNYIFDS